jgi:hypothetical protein
MRPLLALIITLNIVVWGGLLAFEGILAHGVTVTATATMLPRDAQVPKR